jgi:ring-1,2-phenylacetyl-CoA epoxidase subunit PaaE
MGLKNGIDLPYSCKSGVCSTCQAKLISGEVQMDNNYVLSDAELKQGFILTCQSHTITSEVVVDYDMR